MQKASNRGFSASQLLVDSLFKDVTELFVIHKDLVDIAIKVVHVLELIEIELLLLLCHLLHLVVGHRLREHNEAKSVEVKRGFTVGGNACVTIGAPVLTPGVLNNPGRAAIESRLPPNNLEDVVSLEAEGFAGARVNALAICENVGEGIHLSKHGTVRHDLFLNSIDLLSDAVVDDLVDVLGLSALVLLKVFVRALTLLALVGVAHFGKEASALAPREHLVDSAAEALSVVIAVDQFLVRKLDLFVPATFSANTVLGSRDSG